jgi:glycosyltransferase involved in cell wall biosynthesis
MKSLKNAHLALFFTKKTSLATWDRVGNLDREIAIYKQLSNTLKEVSFVTYGGKEDLNFSGKLDSIKLMPIKWHKREIFTTLELILKYYPEIRKIDVLKTNQINGAETPIWIKRKLGKKLITRCGYLYSYFIQKRTSDKEKIENAIRLEREAFKFADVGIVTSKWQKDIVVKNYNIKEEKIEVIPNYVITDIFKPNPALPKEFDLVYIGRSGEQKNLENLLKALNFLKRKNKDLSLLLIGGGYGDKQLRKIAAQYAINVTFKQNIPNFKLPMFLNRAKIFILPSNYEGHPKSLIEAMSCGLPCIGTNVVGIKENTIHMETGYLCDTDYESIAEAIDSVLSDEPLRRYMGKNSREYVLRNYSLDKILKKELAVISEVIGK